MKNDRRLDRSLLNWSLDILLLDGDTYFFVLDWEVEVVNGTFLMFGDEAEVVAELIFIVSWFLSVVMGDEIIWDFELSVNIVLDDGLVGRLIDCPVFLIFKLRVELESTGIFWLFWLKFEVSTTSCLLEILLEI